MKLHEFFENLLLCSWALDKLTKCIVMMSKSASTEIMNFMALGSRSGVGRGSIDNIVKIH